MVIFCLFKLNCSFSTCIWWYHWTWKRWNDPFPHLPHSQWPGWFSFNLPSETRDPFHKAFFQWQMTNISDKSDDNQSEARISITYNNNCHLSLMTCFVKHPPPPPVARTLPLYMTPLLCHWQWECFIPQSHRQTPLTDPTPSVLLAIRGNAIVCSVCCRSGVDLDGVTGVLTCFIFLFFKICFIHFFYF